MSSRISFDFSAQNPYTWLLHFSKMTQSGMMERATLASKEKGEKILEVAVNRIAEILIELHSID
jgi:creatinine amidohydrolase/Fe(II)-dependent formamide hydrolase-like protein